MHLLWYEFPTAGSADPDVFFARSTNRGSSSEASRVVPGDRVVVTWRDDTNVGLRFEIF